MRARIFVPILFLFAISCLVPGEVAAQGCIGVMKPEFSTYSSYVVTSVNGARTTGTLSASLTVDGYVQIGNTEYCNISGAVHTPWVNITVNGVGGKRQNGTGESPYAYIDYSGSVAAPIPVGSQFSLEEEGGVVCNLAGAFFNFSASWLPYAVFTNYVLNSQSIGDVGGIPAYYQCQYKVSCGSNMGTCELPPTYINVDNDLSTPCGNYLVAINIYFPSLGSCFYDVWDQEIPQAVPCT